jgi:hypothetical protein
MAIESFLVLSTCEKELKENRCTEMKIQSFFICALKIGKGLKSPLSFRRFCVFFGVIVRSEFTQLKKRVAYVFV